MGNWGIGNFDDDLAADHLEALTDRLIAEVTEAMSGDPTAIVPDEDRGVAVPCNLELLHLIAQQNWLGANLPDPDTIADWKTKYLAVWETAIDELGPVPGYKERRRTVLVQTFDQLAELAKRKA
jgi:hypothetical protein